MAGRHPPSYTSASHNLSESYSEQQTLHSFASHGEIGNYAQPSTVDCSPRVTSHMHYCGVQLVVVTWSIYEHNMKVTFSEVQEVREVFHGYPPNFF